jgi:hypothetical protein
VSTKTYTSEKHAHYGEFITPSYELREKGRLLITPFERGQRLYGIHLKPCLMWQQYGTAKRPQALYLPLSFGDGAFTNGVPAKSFGLWVKTCAGL